MCSTQLGKLQSCLSNLYDECSKLKNTMDSDRRSNHECRSDLEERETAELRNLCFLIENSVADNDKLYQV